MTDTNLEVDLKDTPQDYRLECLSLAVKMASELRFSDQKVVPLAKEFYRFVESGE